MTNVELEAAEAKIADLKAILADRDMDREATSVVIANLEKDLGATRRAVAQYQIELGARDKEVRTLKETIVKMATSGPAPYPMSPSSAYSMLGDMISGEAYRQEKSWEK